MKLTDLFENEGLPELGDSLSKESVEQWAAQVQRELGLKSFSVYLRNDGAIKLAMIGVSDKKKGTGTKAMEALCAFADSHHRRVLLTPAVKDPNWGTTSQSRLIAFYKRFGFKLNKGRHMDFSMTELMYRDPQITEDVWHGTKHDFDQFSIAHTGTGEGNFTFGWGLYFTDKKEIAEWYRGRIAGNRKGIKIVLPDFFGLGSNPPPYVCEDKDALAHWVKIGIEKKCPFERGDFVAFENSKIDMKASKENYDYFLNCIAMSISDEIFKTVGPRISAYIKNGPEVWARKCFETLKREYLFYDDEEDERLKAQKMIVAAMDCVVNISWTEPNGKLYKVNIPDDTKFLLWDSYFEEQSAVIQQALKAVEKELATKNHKYADGDYFEMTRGNIIYDNLVDDFAFDEYMPVNDAKKLVSLLLLKHGICGIKYYSGETRDRYYGNERENPDYNYVLFTDTNLTVVHKE